MYSVTLKILEGAAVKAKRLHNSSYQLQQLPRAGDVFDDSGRGRVKIVNVVFSPKDGGSWTLEAR